MTETDLYNRIIAAEKRFRAARFNPAPTVPKYGLSASQPIPPPPPPPPSDWVLAANDPNVDDYTPALYYEFSPQTDVWLRFDSRSDQYKRNLPTPYMLLAFTEWTTDQAYYGDWWEAGGFSFYPGDSHQLTSWNLGATNITFISHGHTIGRVYDLHCTYLDDGYSHVPVNLSRWQVDLWCDGVLQEELTIAPNGDNHNWNFRSINSVVIFNQYGSQSAVSTASGVYSGPVIYMDDISVGTSQGAHDIMPNINFSDGTFGPLTLDPGDSGSVDSFSVIDLMAIAVSPPPTTNPTRVISGASGSYSDDNTSVTPTGSGSDYNILGNGIFYQWTAPSNGLVTVRTDSVGTSSPPDIGDTVLYILPNNTTITPNTDELSFNDDDHGPAGYSGSAYYSLTTFTAVAGTTYYFFVKGYNTSETGTFSVSWTY